MESSGGIEQERMTPQVVAETGGAVLDFEAELSRSSDVDSSAAIHGDAKLVICSPGKEDISNGTSPPTSRLVVEERPINNALFSSKAARLHNDMTKLPTQNILETRKVSSPVVIESSPTPLDLLAIVSSAPAERHGTESDISITSRTADSLVKEVKDASNVNCDKTCDSFDKSRNSLLISTEKEQESKVPKSSTTLELEHDTRHKSTRRPVGYAPEPQMRASCRRQRNPTRQRAVGAFPRECFVHNPDLTEIQSQTFTDYVRDMVLPTASAFIHSDSDDDYDNLDRIHEYKPLRLSEGMAKVTLPEGFRDASAIAHDTTGRGPDWQAGTHLGDYNVSSPIEQSLLGLAGTYEYTFREQKPLTLSAFREKADSYRTLQVGSNVTEDTSNGTMYELARKFWQKLSPTMPAAWYGADQEGSLFGNDPASGWSIAQLDSCIHVLSNLPGVTSPYLYAGMWGSVFCAHTEDMNLMSINYLHAGAPKIWYAIAPGPDADRFANLCAFSYSQQARTCKEFMRHKRVLMSPSVLDREGIRYTTAIQRPGDAMITFPGGYHFGFNAGFNMAEATNFGVPEWIPFGLNAKVCMCRPDSVRIDLNRLVTLLKLYQKAEKKEHGLSWKVWADRRAVRILRRQAQSKRELQVLTKKKQAASLRKDFWVEVTPPPEKKKRGKKDKNNKPAEIWRLAKPATRKMITASSKVLLFLPVKVRLGDRKRKSPDCVDPDDLGEECFCGSVSRVMDGHVLVHLDGFPKSADEWIRVTSPKLFLNGGSWEKSDERQAKHEIGVTHFWQEEDSKKLCSL